VRLIDADAVLQWYMKAFKGEIERKEKRFSMLDIDGNLDNIPTVDAVPVIRCKDCKHYAILEDGSNELICDHRDGCMLPKPDGFCNYAEPKRKSKI